MLQPNIDVAALYLRGVPILDIIRKSGHTARWVYRRMEVDGVKPSRNPTHYHDVTTDPNTREVQRLWFIHLNIGVVARKMKRSDSYVARRLPPEVRRIRVYKPRPSYGENPRNLVTSHERRRMFGMFYAGVPIKQIAKRLNRSTSTVFDHISGRRKKSKKGRKPFFYMRWPRPFETPDAAYRDRRYDDVPLKIGSMGAAILAARTLQTQAVCLPYEPPQTPIFAFGPRA